jgi:hypothetical protein
MAILVQDVYTTPSGVQLQNFVLTTKGNILKIEKTGSSAEASYNVLYEIFYYVSQSFYNENKPCVLRELKVLSLDNCSVDIYKCIYDSLKLRFQNYQNI